MDNFCSIESLSHDTKIFYSRKILDLNKVKNDIVNGVENYINGYKNNHIKDTYSYHLPYNYCNINDINRFKSIVEIELKKRNIIKYHFCCSGKGFMISSL